MMPDEFDLPSDSGADKSFWSKLTRTSIIIIWIVYTLAVVTVTVLVMIVLQDRYWCGDHDGDDDGSEALEKAADDYREAVDAFTQGGSTNVCYDGTDEDAPHVYGIFTLEGVGAIPRRAFVDGTVCYGEIIPWESYSSTAPSSLIPQSVHDLYTDVNWS